MLSAAYVVMCVCAAAVSVKSDASVNYCGARVCNNSDAHTFCQYPEGPSPQCIGYISAELTAEEKSRVIARLNRRRNETAAGRLRDLTSAGNMLKLHWVEELAREAQRWADQCRPPNVPEEHDACRDLYSVPVGQCVASVVGEAPGLRVESMVDIWYMQNMLYKGNATTYIPASTNSSFYGDFAQIMWSQSYMVGCGRSRFVIPWQGRLCSVERLVCNIAPRGPPPLRPLWSPSAPATLCPPHSIQDAVLNALCDIQIDFFQENEIDPSMSLEAQILLFTVLDIEQNQTLNYPRSLDKIYMTRLAVATMKDSVITEEYRTSVKRQGIIEIIELEAGKTKTNVSYLDIGEKLQTISSLHSTHRTSVKTKQIIRFIGRPKPYNMEELTNVDYNTKSYLPIEDLTKTQNDFYPEYEFVETMEENSAASTNIVNDSSNLTNITNIDVVTELNSAIVTKLYQNSSMLYEGAESQFGNVNIVYNFCIEDDNKTKNVISMDNGTKAVKDNLDDYLTDPDTVQALQEALDLMERDMATERPTERQGKVRRELRDYIPAKTSEAKAEPTISEAKEQKFTNDMLTTEIDDNRTLQRGAMYNMVMKYMPYLKDYEGQLLSESASKANRLFPSLVLVLSFCV